MVSFQRLCLDPRVPRLRGDEDALVPHLKEGGERDGIIERRAMDLTMNEVIDYMLFIQVTLSLIGTK